VRVTAPWFSGALDLRAYKPGEWVLLEPFRYHSKSGIDYTAPRWFVTDLASIPWLVDPLFDDIDHRAAGVIHDWCYCSQQWSRAEADDLFREMLETIRVGIVKRNLMYSGLRVGGWYRYGQRDGGPHDEDFAWEYMTAAEREVYRLAFRAGRITR
jgi:hypothetical protein